MNANELRVGNLLYYDLTENVCTVNFIYENTFDCRTAIGQLSNGVYNPIPLTEERLLKFGLTPISIGSPVYLNDKIRQKFYIKSETDGFYFYIQQSDDYYDTALLKLDYAHQLQNIYFLLTDEELA